MVNRLLVTVAAVLLAIPQLGAASKAGRPPYTEAHANSGCFDAIGGSVCAADAFADVDGTLQMSLTTETPESGALIGTPSATGDAEITATAVIKEAVSQIPITVVIHVNSAEATGTGAVFEVAKAASNPRSVTIIAEAVAAHAECSACRATRDTAVVVSNDPAGPSSVSDADVVLELTIRDPSGAPVPPGQVIVSVVLSGEASPWFLADTGASHASIDAKLARVAIG
jgi:hypothetical protein